MLRVLVLLRAIVVEDLISLRQTFTIVNLFVEPSAYVSVDRWLDSDGGREWHWTGLWRWNELLEFLHGGAKSRMKDVKECVSRRIRGLQLLRLHRSELTLRFGEFLPKLNRLGFLFCDLRLQRRDLCVGQGCRSDDSENEPRNKRGELFHCGRPPVAKVWKVSPVSSLRVNNPRGLEVLGGLA
jgi:hypothetical protein